jgi:NDP-4-keto-2,6-dideoxyhexose 3-C-methyltransferase
VFEPIKSCRICGNSELLPILDLGMQCLTGVFPKTKDEVVPAAPLVLVKCAETGGSKGCGLVQLRDTCTASALYGESYGYRSGLNPWMAGHLRNKVRQVMETVPLERGDAVVDVGSNDSTLLRAYPEELELERIGVDPLGVKFREFYPANVQLVPEFFTADAVRSVLGWRKAKVVTSVAMFYDLESPEQFVRDVEAVLAEDGVWLLEQSYLPEMLKATSYDTICHEHLEYYALAQIEWLLNRNNLRVLDVDLNAANGGSFAILAGKKTGPYSSNDSWIQQVRAGERNANLQTLTPFRQFALGVSRQRDSMRELLDAAARSGQRVAGYGASTKGNVILQFCGITSRDLPHIAEVNADKFGRFTPGSCIPIVSEAESKSSKPDMYLVLPWHFRSYILERESNFLAGGGQLVFPLPAVDVVQHAQLVPASTETR